LKLPRHAERVAEDGLRVADDREGHDVLFDV
jgi:hypothetical protein